MTVAAGQNKGSDYSAKIEKIENSATYGKLTLGKYGATANGSADMNKPLSDVEFTVYTDAECEEAKATLTTGADGAVTSGWLVPGTYYIKETKADGYVLLEDVYKVTVAANKVTDTAVVVGSDPEATIKLTELVNEKKGGFTIKSMAFIFRHRIQAHPLRLRFSNSFPVRNLRFTSMTRLTVRWEIMDFRREAQHCRKMFLAVKWSKRLKWKTIRRPSAALPQGCTGFGKQRRRMTHGIVLTIC